MARHKDANWVLADPIATNEHVMFALLMDLRDELKELNRQFRKNEYGQGYITRELRGLRRDVKPRMKPRCHRAHLPEKSVSVRTPK